jgi:hypothetical protein
MLRMHNNPVEESDQKEYRKQAVMGIPHLMELDKVKVIEAERLVYSGLLPPPAVK